MPETHNWSEVIFNYGSWLECECGFVAHSEKDFNAHNEEVER